MKLKVLIIDDDKIIRKTLEKYFIELDFDVTVAEDGETAMSLIEKNRPELVVSDMLIPGTHGIEICKKIKQNPDLSGIKVILMSSVYKRSDTVDKELECNYDIFLEKPFDFNDLVGVMRQLNLEGFK